MTNQTLTIRRMGLKKAAITVSFLALFSSNPLIGAEVTLLKARIVNSVSGNLYVDVGSGKGIKLGDVGRVMKHGIEINQAEVVEIDIHSATLKLISVVGIQVLPTIGDQVFFQLQVQKTDEDSSPFLKHPKQVLEESDRETEFVPLRTPIPKRKMGFPRIADVFHGKVNLRQLFQVDSENHLDYSLTRLGMDGSLDRIGGTPWSFEWDADITYRKGDAFRNRDDYQKPELDLDEIFFQRKLHHEGFLRLGRFLPRELSSIGYVDGIQGESPLSEVLSVGAVLGLKPDRQDLDFTLVEPLTTAYISAQMGTRRELYYSGTMGFLGSMFDGKINRAALLWDQRADVGPKLNLYSSSAVDVDIGKSKVRSGLSLTRLHLQASSPINKILTLRVGTSHYERSDTPSERDLLPFQNEQFFDSGYWRYWIGGTQKLPWNLRVTEELTYIDPAGGDADERWRLTLMRRGLPWMPSGNVTLSMYSLTGIYDDGYGGYLSGYFSFMKGKISIRPRYSFRIVENVQGSKEFEATYVSVYGDWRFSKSLSFNVGFTHTTGDSLSSTLIDLGLVQRW